MEPDDAKRGGAHRRKKTRQLMIIKCRPERCQMRSHRRSMFMRGRESKRKGTDGMENRGVDQR